MGVMHSLIESSANLLEPCEREAVLGDLEEAGNSAWRGLVDVSSLVIRREAALWTRWQPWTAAFALALPSSLMLMGASLSLCSVSSLSALSWPLLMLIGWAFTCGFAVASISRRTLWASAIASASPCLFCFSKYHGHRLPAVCLYVFLLPALLGIWRGLRNTSLDLRPALALAIALTALMIPEWRDRGLFNLPLLWPAWYIAANAWRTAR